MCDNGRDFKFCTCIGALDTNDDNIYIWRLGNFIKHKQNQHDIGKMIEPKNYKGKVITINVLLEKLNSNTCFDFEYSPSENDYFSLQIPGDEDLDCYLNAVYKNNQWVEGRNSPFSGKAQKINQGTMQFKN
jgi:hypothetical protein